MAVDGGARVWEDEGGGGVDSDAGEHGRGTEDRAGCSDAGRCSECDGGGCVGVAAGVSAVVYAEVRADEAEADVAERNDGARVFES